MSDLPDLCRAWACLSAFGCRCFGGDLRCFAVEVALHSDEIYFPAPPKPRLFGDMPPAPAVSKRFSARSPTPPQHVAVAASSAVWAHTAASSSSAACRVPRLEQEVCEGARTPAAAVSSEARALWADMEDEMPAVVARDAGKKTRKRNRNESCLASTLEQVCQLNPAQVLRCGRLRQLGPKCMDRLVSLLEEHFGKVSQILPASLPTNGTQSALAFVVMESEQDAQEVLRQASSLLPFADLAIRQFDGQ